jgi:hypothetical protein
MDEHVLPAALGTGPQKETIHTEKHHEEEEEDGGKRRFIG